MGASCCCSSLSQYSAVSVVIEAGSCRRRCHNNKNHSPRRDSCRAHQPTRTTVYTTHLTVSLGTAADGAAGTGAAELPLLVLAQLWRVLPGAGGPRQRRCSGRHEPGMRACAARWSYYNCSAAWSCGAGCCQAAGPIGSPPTHLTHTHPPTQPPFHPLCPACRHGFGRRHLPRCAGAV